MMKSINLLRVYTSWLPMIRIGKDNDGGYLLADLKAINVSYDAFLSGGISNDVSFEVMLLDRYPDLRCHAFDPTIDALPETHRRLQFHKLAVGSNSSTSTNLSPFLESCGNALIKMDIEGGEYPWLDSLADADLSRIAQMVIEFHHLRQLGRWDLLERLNVTHRLVHIHPNNHAGKSGGARVAGVFIPDIFECTYVRKDLIPHVLWNSHTFPHPLDQKNVPEMEDITLTGPPFVN